MGGSLAKCCTDERCVCDRPDSRPAVVRGALAHVLVLVKFLQLAYKTTSEMSKTLRLAPAVPRRTSNVRLDQCVES